jgi:hypothetical protein
MAKKIFLFLLTVWFISISGFAIFKVQQKVPKEKAEYPRVEIKDTEVRTLRSKAVGREYSINIFFPKDYDKESRRYPAVYVLDAEYNFGV